MTTSWKREIINGRMVIVITAPANDSQGAADLVAELLPQLLAGEEIRVQPITEPADEVELPWGK